MNHVRISLTWWALVDLCHRTHVPSPWVGPATPEILPRGVTALDQAQSAVAREPYVVWALVIAKWFLSSQKISLVFWNLCSDPKPAPNIERN